MLFVLVCSQIAALEEQCGVGGVAGICLFMKDLNILITKKLPGYKSNVHSIGGNRPTL